MYTQTLIHNVFLYLHWRLSSGYAEFKWVVLSLFEMHWWPFSCLSEFLHFWNVFCFPLETTPRVCLSNPECFMSSNGMQSYIFVYYLSWLLVLYSVVPYCSTIRLLEACSVTAIKKLQSCIIHNGEQIKKKIAAYSPTSLLVKLGRLLLLMTFWWIWEKYTCKQAQLRFVSKKVFDRWLKIFLNNYLFRPPSQPSLKFSSKRNLKISTPQA